MRRTDITTETTKNETETKQKREVNDFFRVVCPFFHDLHGSVIRCEGLIPDTLMTTYFKNPKELKKHRIKYCDTFCYGGCQLGKVLLEKYGDAPRA